MRTTAGACWCLPVPAGACWWLPVEGSSPAAVTGQHSPSSPSTTHAGCAAHSVAACAEASSTPQLSSARVELGGHSSAAAAERM
jgi:hypothetical protein